MLTCRRVTLYRFRKKRYDYSKPVKTKPVLEDLLTKVSPENVHGEMEW